MRILHVITSLKIGGAQRLLADLIPLQATSIDVSLLVYERVDNDFEKAIEQAGINIFSLDEKNFYNPRVIFRLRKIFKDYDVVHAHLFPTIYWVSFAARGLKVKLIYTEHNTFNRRRNKAYLRPIEKFVYFRYNKIICISTKTQDNLIDWLQSNDSRFVTIPNGVNTKVFANENAEVDKKRLIMVARFAPAKDQATVIKALSYLGNDIKLCFVGDGETMKECQKLASQLNLCSQIEFMGTQTDIPRLIAQSYIGIQSSLWEGFGLTAVEMMAAGKPVIASDVDGLKQVVEGAGLLFPFGDEKSLAKAIEKLMSDEGFYEKVSLACKKRSEIFDISRMADGYMDVYKSL